MISDTFDTPEAAALVGFTDAHVRVAAVVAQGDDAYVLLDTGEAVHPYLYGSCVARQDGGWVELASGNGDGWTLTTERELGTLAVWGEAPASADQARVVFGGEAREIPVTGGVYLTAWWRVPCPEHDFPRAEAFRVGREWVAEPAAD